MQSVKYALLGLLAAEPRHGYDLKSAFEELFGGSWKLNIGQVYSTLGRLERDGLVVCEIVPQDLVPDRKVYRLTDDGGKALRAWLGEPADGPVRLKEELFVKVLVHGLLDGRGPTELIARQRQACLARLGELAAIRADASTDPTTRLLVDGAMLHLEADLRWLELCEDRTRGRG